MDCSYHMSGVLISLFITVDFSFSGIFTFLGNYDKEISSACLTVTFNCVNTVYSFVQLFSFSIFLLLYNISSFLSYIIIFICQKLPQNYDFMFFNHT